jgi:hypothetical protein
VTASSSDEKVAATGIRREPVSVRQARLSRVDGAAGRP